MERGKRKLGMSGVLASLLVGGELFFALDMLCTRSDSVLSTAGAIAAFTSGFVLCMVLGFLNKKLLKRLTFGLTALLLAAALLLGLGWYIFSKNAVYRDVDSGSKAAIFADKKVMVIVPHEDDEINILGGVFEQYLSYGSRVQVVYVTNGDMSVDAERRYAETIEGMARVGIPETDLIFLGYGDSMSADGQMLYFCPGNMVVESPAGFTATYGTESHPPFRSDREYTLNNMYGDIRDVILRNLPDVIFCSEYDEHGDHRMVSLLFDCAMGEILADREDYEPQVFKAFAYSTAYEAVQDFYAVNMLSTQNPSGQSYMPESNVYSWSGRLRLPVKASALSRSIFSDSIYQALSRYDSQYTTKMADGIINSDKVFWHRETGSECYTAEVTASSGNAALTHDFMLIDRLLPYSPITPAENTWIPLGSDEEKTLTVIFPEERPLGRIKLYDNPSLEDNVLNARILFDDGSELQSGPLPINGSVLELEFEPKWVKSLEISLTETEGDNAGLTEVEAFSKPYSSGFSFIKLMNENGDFVYDYYIDSSGQEDFRLYVWRCSNDLSCYRVFCQGDEGCSAKVADGKLRVICPKGKSCTVSVSNADGSLSDSVYIRNRGTGFISAMQGLEQYVRKEFAEGMIYSNSWKMLNAVYDAISGNE